LKNAATSKMKYITIYSTHISLQHSALLVPDVIRNLIRKEDYVVFKVDIDSPEVEQGTIDHLLLHDDDLNYIDEFSCGFHIAGENGGNYLLPAQSNQNTTLKDMYNLFSQLRRSGVQAHSWI
jgi:hypothetical protein